MLNYLSKLWLILVLTFAFYGCWNWDIISFGVVVKPEDMKHYKPSGTLVAISVDRTKFFKILQLRLMLDNAADITLFTPKDKNFFIADVPLKCKGLIRVGAELDTQSIGDWYYLEFKFTLESNKVNYLGKFILEEDKTIGWNRLYVTNTIEEDKELFLEYYPTLSNTEFVVVPVTNGVFKAR